MQLDTLDKQIIIALEDDGRRPYRDIARDLGVAEGTIRARVSRLIDQGSIKITAVGDPLSLGVDVVGISLIRVKPGHVGEVAERLAGFANIRFVGTSFGSADIIVQTLHTSVQALHDFVAKELPALAPEITSTETFQLAEVLKSSWDWRAWFAQDQDEKGPELGRDKQVKVADEGR